MSEGENDPGEDFSGDDEYGDDDGEGGLSYAEEGYGFDGQTQAVLVAGRSFEGTTRNQMRALRDLAGRWAKTLGKDVVSVACGDVSPETGAAGDSDDDNAYVSVVLGIEIASAHADGGLSKGRKLEELREAAIDALRALPEELWNEVAAALTVDDADDEDAEDDEDADDAADDGDDEAAAEHAWLAAPVGRSRADEGLYLCACGPLPAAMMSFGVACASDAQAAEGLEVSYGCNMSQERHDEGVHGVSVASCDFSCEAVDLGDEAHAARVTSTAGLAGQCAYYFAGRYD